MSSWNCHIFSQIICGSLPWLWATRLIINRNEKCPSLCENQWRKPCVIYRQNKPFCKSETVLFRLWIISKDCFFSHTAMSKRLWSLIYFSLSDFISCASLGVNCCLPLWPDWWASGWVFNDRNLSTNKKKIIFFKFNLGNNKLSICSVQMCFYFAVKYYFLFIEMTCQN